MAMQRYNKFLNPANFSAKKFKKSAFFYILPAFCAFLAGKMDKKSPASYHYGAGANTKIIQ